VLSAGVVGLALALSACAAEQPAAVRVTVEPDVATPKSSPPKPDVPVVWPLTGVETKQVAKRPALAIKIENSIEARPQTGLEYADVVWEQVVEGGISRFVAVYQSRIPDRVEPVRSVRPMDAGIVAPLKGVLAFSGGQPRFIREVKAAGVQTVIMDDGAPGFRRDPARRAPHNVIGTPQTFLDQARNRAAPPPAQFLFARAPGKGSATVAGRSATTLNLKLSPGQRSVWTWDKASATWLRSNGSVPAVSTAGKRLSARNVVVLSVRLVPTGAKDPAGNPVPETKMVDSGAGFVASRGKTLRVHWSKKSTGAPLVLTASGGKPVQLEPGNTWVELVPRGTGDWSVS
jgi:hypothetical protein